MNSKGLNFAIIGVSLLFCIFLVEVILRLSGFLPGVMQNTMYPPDSVVYVPLFQADSLGISSYLKDSELLPSDYIINRQGFRSEFDYTQNTIDEIRNREKRNLVFLVGDSYTEGCCASPIDSSFSDLLAQNSNDLILNFGVGVTGLHQYLRIVERYVPDLKPDLVVIAFYLGNDICDSERPETPNVPVSYPIKDFHWLNSVGAPHHMFDRSTPYFSDYREAYNFYIDTYTLYGENVNWVENIIKNSVLVSRLYLIWNEFLSVIKYTVREFSFDDKIRLTNATLDKIKKICYENGSGFLIVAIPSPKDVLNKTDLENKYQKYFVGKPVRYPAISKFNISDYDGKNLENHFRNSGHYKFYQFLTGQPELTANE